MLTKMQAFDNNITFKPTGFEYVNPNAKIVLVGITPGNTQLASSRAGKTPREIKRENAFAGAMRNNLVRMLDLIGVNKLLGTETCATLWHQDFDKVEMTSLLKEATFLKGKMFNKASAILKSDKLTRALNDGFVHDCSSYSKACLFVAMGAEVGKVLFDLKDKGIITAEIIVLPHPSGANSGRVAVFLGSKQHDDTDQASTRAYEQSRVAMETVKRLNHLNHLNP